MLETLRHYQNEARYQMNTLLNASRSPVFVSPTGTGKSRTIAAIIADRISLGRRVFLLVPTDETFQQWVKEFIAWGLNPGTIDQKGISGTNRKIYVCMYYSLNNLLSYIPENIFPDEIAIDELHHFPTTTIERIHGFFHSANWFGCTATLWRLDGKKFSHIFTDIVQTITMKEAVEKKFLAKPLVIVPKIYLDKIKIVDGEYDAQEQIGKLGKPQIIGDVIENYSTVFAGKQVLVACCNLDHAKDMAEKFCAAGWDFKHIHGNLPRHERRKLIKDLREGRINGLTTYAVGTEGADIVGLHGIIWLRRTTSLTIYLQLIGRCLRPAKGKKYGIILDPVGNLFIHGFPDADRKWSLEATEIDEWGDVDPDLQAATMRRCPFCGVMNAAVNTTCHFCGAELDSPEAKAARARHLPAMVDGELVAVESDGQAQTIRERAETIRREQADRREQDAAKQVEAEEAEMSPGGKAHFLREGLLANRRKIFTEAVKEFL